MKISRWMLKQGTEALRASWVCLRKVFNERATTWPLRRRSVAHTHQPATLPLFSQDPVENGRQEPWPHQQEDVNPEHDVPCANVTQFQAYHIAHQFKHHVRGPDLLGQGPQHQNGAYRRACFLRPCCLPPPYQQDGRQAKFKST